MQREATSWKHGVVLICTNERGPEATRPSCGHAPGKELKGWLKAKTRAEGGPAAGMRVLTTSCLDLCPSAGVAVAIMPGTEVLTVDPERDRAALLAEVQAHAQQLSDAPPEGRRARARSLLTRLRK